MPPGLLSEKSYFLSCGAVSSSMHQRTVGLFGSGSHSNSVNPDAAGTYSCILPRGSAQMNVRDAVSRGHLHT